MLDEVVQRDALTDDQQTFADDYQDDWRPETSDNFKVVIRVRPPLPRELRGTALRPFQCTTSIDNNGRIITLSENLPAVLGGMGDALGLYATHRFTFDHVYDQACSQDAVYGGSAQQVVLSILQGYNAAIIAYGQTGTGKTYTMEGELQGPERGIIPRTVEDIFTHIVNDPEPTSKYLVRASYLQIYNEVISDLLKPDRTNLVIREDRRRGVFVEGLSEWVVRSPGEVYQLMEMGRAMRATGATKLNEVSSRSHAVCIIIVEKCTTVVEGGVGAVWPARPGTAGAGGKDVNAVSQIVKVGKLSLVDLAGSERVHVTGAVGRRLEESKKINASLSALGNVIAALTDTRAERKHIPYRDSKLTRILEDTLGGNCKTTMICTVAPALDAFQESLSTLKFANRAKTIKNEAHVNEDLDQRTLLRKYERELRKLRAELQKRSKSLVDKRALLEAEEQTRKAEADKLAVLTALEKRSKELMKEKEEKLALEAKISAMQSQLLVGGVALVPPGTAMRSGSTPALARTGLSLTAGSLEEVPAFKQLLQKEQKRIRSEYEARLRELEGERQAVEEDRQQVDRYKQLLLKQRDIMIALTARLNERDEQIMALQEELEMCDRHQRQLEDALDNRTAELYALRKAAAEAANGEGQNTGALNSLINKWSNGSVTGPTAAEEDAWVPLEATEVTRLPTGLPSSASLSMAGGETGRDEIGSPAANIIQQLQSDNHTLREQLAQAQAAAAHATLLNEDKASDSGATELIEVLTQACEGAQRERSALQQILDTRVKKMMTELLTEVSRSDTQNDLPEQQALGQQRVLHKLQAIEVVLDKVAAAIRAAPPLLPPDVARAQSDVSA